jgi:hypothetical protein
MTEVHTRAWPSVTTLPDDGEASEAFNLIECAGGESRHVFTGNIQTVFARILCGVSCEDVFSTSADLLNLAVVQPLVNPAFESLFWLALAEDSGPAGHRENLYELALPMTYEMKHHPARHPSPAEVRRAQVAFLRERVPELDAQDALTLSESAWAARCAQELAQQWVAVDRHVLHDVFERAGEASALPGASPFV